MAKQNSTQRRKEAKPQENEIPPQVDCGTCKRINAENANTSDNKTEFVVQRWIVNQGPKYLTPECKWTNDIEYAQVFYSATAAKTKLGRRKGNIITKEIPF